MRGVLSSRGPRSNRVSTLQMRVMFQFDYGVGMYLRWRGGNRQHLDSDSQMHGTVKSRPLDVESQTRQIPPV